MRFKNFLNEDNNYYNVKIGDILNALQNISQDIGVLDKKSSETALVSVVNQIRPLLKNNINKNYAPILQKIAVFIMNGLEKNTDLKLIVDSCIESLSSVLSKSKLPIDKLNKVKDFDLPPSENKSQKEDLPNPVPPNQGQEETPPALSGDVDNSSLTNL